MPAHVTYCTDIDPDARVVEVVERKGGGHPDTVCDALAEEFGQALCGEYQRLFGAVLHHNVDKALLFGGASRPAFGGGEVLAPIEIYLAGRATAEFRGVRIPIDELAEGACHAWLSRRFHALDPQRHVKIRCLTRPGSPDLVELFLRQRKTGMWLANDTSCGVGFSPLTELERVVLAVERQLNSAEVKAAHPETGEDVKVMGVRNGDELALTVAVAGVDRYLHSYDEYSAARLRWAELAQATAERHTRRRVTVAVNAADDVSAEQIYLTVTGTSAEAGDDGQVGRGNRSNGLITPCRPMTMEAAAGKNPASHVGKLYNAAAGRIAEHIVNELPEAACVECCLVSQIGRPVQHPQLAEVRLQPRPGVAARTLTARVEQIVARELEQLDQLSRSLAQGEICVY